MSSNAQLLPPCPESTVCTTFSVTLIIGLPDVSHFPGFISAPGFGLRLALDAWELKAISESVSKAADMDRIT